MRFSAMGCLLLAGVLLAACSQTAGERGLPVAGKDGVRGATVQERRSDVLLRWARLGVRDATLISVSTPASLGAVPADVLSRLTELYRARDWQGFGAYAGQHIDAANWLAAAVRLGMVREVDWVVPYRLFDDPALAEGKIKRFLRERTAFSPADVEALHMDAGCLAGRVAGAALFVCSPRTLHRIDGGILLFFDGGTVPDYYHQYQVTNLATLKEIFDELAYREVRVRDAALVTGVADGTGTPVHAFLADEFADGLRRPDRFRGDAPPELWLLRDKVDDRMMAGDRASALSELRTAQSRHPDDRPLQLLADEAGRLPAARSTQ